MLGSYSISVTSFNHLVVKSLRSTLSLNVSPPRASFNMVKKWYSLRAKSGLYSKEDKTSQSNSFRTPRYLSSMEVSITVEETHSFCQYSPYFVLYGMPQFLRVSQRACSLIVVSQIIKSTSIIPFLSQKMDAMIFQSERIDQNLLALGECVWRHCIDFL